MNPLERNLLIRVARRLEEYATSTAHGLDRDAATAKRRLDRELGDVRELREYIKRDEPKTPAP